MRLRVPIEVKEFKRYVVASCPALDVVSQGDTVKLAKKNLGEALAAFFTSCLERGVLDEVLKDCGFKAVCKRPRKRPASQVAPPQDYLNIPLHLLSEEGENLCHA
jgi:predicted RNase H-like HicB family nuclease